MKHVAVILWFLLYLSSSGLVCSKTFCFAIIVLSECHCSTFCMNKVSCLLSAEWYQFSFLATSNPQCCSSMHPMQAMRVEFSLDEECYHAYSSNSLNSQWIDFVLLLLVQGLACVLK